ncbi:ornithine carbamoyltransferase, partial [Candidatus Bathyarchaeota archaeon]|nr:ornithine carbamoyltransferase [Candidatus Bathyarchaeota archaeon]
MKLEVQELWKMHLVNFKGLTDQQLMEIVDEAIEVKHNPEKYQTVLNGKSLAMIFQKSSTRTRIS